MGHIEQNVEPYEPLIATLGGLDSKYFIYLNVFAVI